MKLFEIDGRLINPMQVTEIVRHEGLTILFIGERHQILATPIDRDEVKRRFNEAVADISVVK